MVNLVTPAYVAVSIQLDAQATGKLSPSWILVLLGVSKITVTVGAGDAENLMFMNNVYEHEFLLA